MSIYRSNSVTFEQCSKGMVQGCCGVSSRQKWQGGSREEVVVQLGCLKRHEGVDFNRFMVCFGGFQGLLEGTQEGSDVGGGRLQVVGEGG
jgi:hypothetical protein